MRDPTEWREHGQSAKHLCMERARNYISKAFLDEYFRNHGFHDWSLVKLNVFYRNHSRYIAMLLQNYDSTTELCWLTFSFCSFLEIVSNEDTDPSGDSLLIMSFDREDGDIKAGLGFSSGMEMYFRFRSAAAHSGSGLE